MPRPAPAAHKTSFDEVDDEEEERTLVDPPSFNDDRITLVRMPAPVVPEKDT